MSAELEGKPERAVAEETLSPSDPEFRSDVISLIQAEYNALRREIEWLVGNATQYQNFGIVATAAGVTALGVISDRAPKATVAVFAGVPLLLWLFARLQLRAYEEIHVAAGYIADRLAQRVRVETRIEDLWSWEEYKASFNPASRRLAIEKASLFRRKLLFVFPGALFLGAGLTVLLVTSELSPAERWTPLWWLAAVGLLVAAAAIVDILRYTSPYLSRPSKSSDATAGPPE